MWLHDSTLLLLCNPTGLCVAANCEPVHDIREGVIGDNEARSLLANVAAGSEAESEVSLSQAGNVVGALRESNDEVAARAQVVDEERLLLRRYVAEDEFALQQRVVELVARQLREVRAALRHEGARAARVDLFDANAFLLRHLLLHMREEA